MTGREPCEPVSESNIGGNPEARIDWAFGESQKAGNERTVVEDEV